MFHVSQRENFFVDGPPITRSTRPTASTKGGSRCLAMAVCALVALLLSQVAGAQSVEDFEGPTPSFSSVQQFDCQYRVLFHARVNNEKRGGLQSESIAYELGRIGSELFVIHDIPDAQVIRELTPSMWVKATRPGIRLYVRAVYPRTTAEGPEGGPLKVLIPGPSYTAVNQWQHLSFGHLSYDMKQLVEDQTRKLRRKLTKPFDDRDVYVDQVVVNLFTSPGRTNVWFDDLQVEGAVSTTRTVSTSSVSDTVHDSSSHVQRQGDADRVAPPPKILVERKGTVLEVKGDAFFAKAIQYQGERLEFLAGLGFNTVIFPNQATHDQLKKAVELGLWVVCPPPPSFETATKPELYDRVLAWNMGRRLDRNLLEMTRQQSVRLKSIDKRWQRPLFGQVNTGIWEYSRILDIVNVGQPVVGTGFDLADYDEWVQQKTRLAQGGTLFWPVVQTGSTPEQMQQAVAMSTKGVRWNVDPQIIKYLALTSIGAGARGVFFASRERIDSLDEISRLRAKSLKWINQQLDKVAPWAAGGTFLGMAASTDPMIKVAVLKTRGSRLLIATTKSTDLIHPPYRPRNTFFIDDQHASRSAIAYRINEAGIVPLIYSQHHNGLRIKIDSIGLAEAIVVTDDPLAIDFLQRESTRDARLSILGLHREITDERQKSHLRLQSELASNTRTNHRAVEFSRLSLEKYSHARKALDTGHVDLASNLLTQSDLFLMASRQSSIEAAVVAFPTNTASPLCMQMETLPFHWQMADRLKSSRFSLNALPAGEFEDLNHMKGTGWQYNESPLNGIQTGVELSSQVKKQGKYSLHLEAKSIRPGDEVVGTIELAPIWVTTAPIQVRQGQIFRISGWVNVPREVAGSVDGMMVIDSHSGPIYSSYFKKTEGWQPFTLYRGVNSDGPLTVTFALTGIGDAYIDDVSIQIAEPLPASSNRSQDSQPSRGESSASRPIRGQPSMSPLGR